ncbi:electron transfer flavoprotein subunit alpha/FixB family protein [Labedella populi]|uniref:Electron transfer flavoprotein subunit alpha/FixB family protein n=1 Tax=Labedella populi TaxID=2498850 RepID=A0A444QFI0_9MICO|nr:electron transfer flavoprotein subunit alpha/FixB family protein [Labedella populi]RWZ68352.1 electron transfer flavoprotein subunit alpha/FixB family protein [Labedella populi]
MTCVVVEVVDGELTSPSRDAVALAVSLAPVTAVSATVLPSAVLGELGDAGVHDALVGSLGSGSDEPVSTDAMLAGLLAELDHDRTVVVTPSSGSGRQIAGRLAVRLSLPVLGSVTAVERVEAGLLATTTDGAHRVRVQTAEAAVLVARPTGRAAAARVGGSAAVSRPMVSAADGTRERVQSVGWAAHSAGHDAALDRSRIVVVGGRGLGSPDTFARARSWAHAIGAAFGSSRAPVEAGWASYDELVGQTGTTIAPEVYLAFGVAGAPQHRAGMRGAAVVVAINSDPGAPIIDDADVVVIGDAAETLAALEAASVGEPLV